MKCRKSNRDGDDTMVLLTSLVFALLMLFHAAS